MRSRDRIIAATMTLIETDGFEVVNMTSAAAAGGVTRQTVHNIFGSREALIAQTLVTAAASLLAEVQREAEELPTVEFLTEVCVAVRRAVREVPLFARLVVPSPANPLFQEGMMVSAHSSVRILMLSVAERDPPLAERLLSDEFAEIVARLGITLLLFDSELADDDDRLRRLLVQVFGAFLTADPA